MTLAPFTKSAQNMTSDQAVSWILDVIGPQPFLAGVATGYVVADMVRALAKTLGTALTVTSLATGEVFDVFTTRTRKHLRTRVAYHARFVDTFTDVPDGAPLCESYRRHGG